jgi:hypothetical protein
VVDLPQARMGRAAATVLLARWLLPQVAAVVVEQAVRLRVCQVVRVAVVDQRLERVELLARQVRAMLVATQQQAQTAAVVVERVRLDQTAVRLLAAMAAQDLHQASQALRLLMLVVAAVQAVTR